jgi:hypothetical protein
MKEAMILGMRPRSDRSEAAPSPTIRAPRRMAKRLNAVEIRVNASEATMLAASSGVPRAQCTANSSECASVGSTTSAATVPSTAGSRRRNACVSAP